MTNVMGIPGAAISWPGGRCAGAVYFHPNDRFKFNPDSDQSLEGCPDSGAILTVPRYLGDQRFEITRFESRTPETSPNRYIFWAKELVEPEPG